MTYSLARVGLWGFWLCNWIQSFESGKNKSQIVDKIKCMLRWTRLLSSIGVALLGLFMHFSACLSCEAESVDLSESVLEVNASNWCEFRAYRQAAVEVKLRCITGYRPSFDPVQSLVYYLRKVACCVKEYTNFYVNNHFGN